MKRSIPVNKSWEAVEKRKRQNDERDDLVEELGMHLPDVLNRYQKLAELEVLVERKVQSIRRLLAARFSQPVKKMKTLRVFAHHKIHNQPGEEGNTPRRLPLVRNTPPTPGVATFPPQGPMYPVPGSYPQVNQFDQNGMRLFNIPQMPVQAAPEPPNQFQSGQFNYMPEQERPGWTLVVEGCFPGDPNLKEPKFSTFFEKIVVFLDKKIYSSPGFVEWKPPTASSEETAPCDGCCLTMDGDCPTNVAIAFYRRFLGKPFYKPSKQLAKILKLPKEEGETKNFFIGALIEYIKKHNLQKRVDDKRMIYSDAALKEIFNCDSFMFSTVSERLNAHLLPPDPIVMEYSIEIPLEPKARDNFFDFEVEVEDTFQKQVLDFLENSSRLKPEYNQHLDSFENQICFIKDQLKGRIKKAHLLESFGDDPFSFLKSVKPIIESDIKRPFGKGKELFQDEIPSWMEVAANIYLNMEKTNQRAQPATSDESVCENTVVFEDRKNQPENTEKQRNFSASTTAARMNDGHTRIQPTDQYRNVKEQSIQNNDIAMLTALVHTSDSSLGLQGASYRDNTLS